MRFFLCLFLFIALLPPVWAAGDAPKRELPIISFAQKVSTVVEAKHNPEILDMRIEQDSDDTANITLTAIVDRVVDRDRAKAIALNLVMLTKAMTLDNHPTKNDEPGKGLYNYGVRINRVDEVVLASAHKMAGEEKLTIDPPVMGDLPLQYHLPPSGPRRAGETR